MKILNFMGKSTRHGMEFYEKITYFGRPTVLIGLQIIGLPYIHNCNLIVG